MQIDNAIIMKYLNITHFAQAYNCDAYGAGAYNEGGQCVTSTGTAPGTNLPSTGTDVFIGIGVGIALIVAAVVLVVRSRRKK